MKRIFSILLALCVSSMLSAQLSIWDGTDDVWTKGAGTASSPYLIESAQQLAFIASMVNGGVTTYENTYFKLMTNVNLNNMTWSPIGSSSVHPFKGHFDGNNHQIYGNILYNLFGYCTGGTIQRVYVEAKQFASEANNCNFNHCFYKGQLAMVSNANNCIIFDCLSHVTNGTKAAYAEKATNCQYINCLATGNIVSNITQSYAHDVIVDYSDVNSTGEFSQIMSTGGMVCVSKYCTYIQCQSNCNTVTTTSNVDPLSVGVSKSNICAGFIGISMGDQIRYCSNTNLSTGYFPIPGSFQLQGKTYYTNGCELKKSGFVGLNTKSTSSIKNSYTINEVLYVRGGIVVNDTKRYNSLTTSTTNSYTILNKTKQVMKSASFPIVLNTDSTVFIQDITPNVNSGYPIYANQVYLVTDALTTIGFTSAQLLGHYYALNTDSVGFEYKKKNDNTHWYQSVTGQASGNIITCDLSDLIVGTDYVYRVWVERNGVRYFGEEMTFTTLQCSKTVKRLTASVCQGEEYSFKDQQLTRSGTYRDTLVATNGCDSIIELTLTVMPTSNIDKYDTIMVGESYDFYGEILTESGDYEHYVPMVNRCNLIILHLYVRQPNVALTVNVNDPQMGSVGGAGSFEKYTEHTIKAVPNEGYHFVQWNDGNTDNPRTIVLTQDTVLRAYFEKNSYTIQTESSPSDGGDTFGDTTALYLDTITLTAVADEHYHFVRWSDGDLNATRQIIVTQDSTYTAIFEKDKYLILFIDDDETELKRDSIEYGVMPIAPTNPTKEPTAEYTYTFAGWTPEVVAVTGEATYTAKYDSVVNQYTITWQNEDGTLIDQTTVEYGIVPTHVDPIKTNTAEYTYMFAGWTPEVVAVTEDATYTAIFDSVVNTYTISVNAINGDVEGAGVYAYGTEVKLKAIPANGYEFNQWSDGNTDNPRTIVVTGDAEYTALFVQGQGLEDIYISNPVQKIMIDNTIYILRDGKTYTIQGQEVKQSNVTIP